MQPPTKPTPATSHERSAPRGDETDLYLRHHHNLHRAVAQAVNAPRELVEDACQTAWTALLQSQPDRIAIFGWLYVVATREARRLRKRDRRHTHLDAIVPEGSWDTVVSDASSIDDMLDAHEALRILASLPDRQRADLTLRVAGFSYVEIAEMTGGRTYTNVNKNLAKARARVRLARLADTANSGAQSELASALGGATARRRGHPP